MKGLIFSMDAMFALVIVMVIVPILLTVSVQRSDEKVFSILQMQAEDSINVISNLRVSDVRAEPVIDDLFTEGVLTNSDLNTSILEILGSLWASGNSTLNEDANNISKHIIGKIIPDNVMWSVTLDSEKIYNNSGNITKTLTLSKRIVSGIEKGSPPKGFLSNAFVKGIDKQFSSYFFFGGFIGQGNITATIRNIPPNSNVTSMYLELNAGDDFDFYINNNLCKNMNVSGNFTVDKWTITDPSCTGSVGGNVENNFTINFTSGNITKSFIGGGFLKVTYTTDSFLDVPSNRYYFPGVEGLVNIFDSFHANGNISSINITLHYSTVSNFSVLMTMGNATIFNTSSDGTEETVFINTSTIENKLQSSGLSYSYLSEKTIPIRLFVNANITGGLLGGDTDIVLITDRSGSMDWRLDQDSTTGVEINNCDDPNLFDNSTKRISLAKCLAKDFVHSVLGGNESSCPVGTVLGNRISLVSFGTSSDEISSVGLTNDIGALENEINSYDADMGATCVSCAINRATDILIQESNYTRVKYIIVMTDGETNRRSTDSCSDTHGIDAKNSNASFIVGELGIAAKLKDSVWESIPSSGSDLWSVKLFNETLGFAVGSGGNGDSWILRSSAGGFSGAGYMSSEPDDGTNQNTNYIAMSPELEYFVNFSNAGTYYVWLRVYGSGSSDNSAHAGYDDTGPSSSDRIEVTTFNSWVWTKSTMDGVDATIPFSLGIHKLNIWEREDGFFVDKIILTTNASFVPAGAGPLESPRSGGAFVESDGIVVIEAENFDSNNVVTNIIKWNGTEWSGESGAGSVTLYDVAFVNSTIAFAVGSGGDIYKWDSSSWNLDQDMGTSDIRGVSAADGRAFAVGSSAKVYEWLGSTWTQIDDFGSFTFYDVAFINKSYAFAVGSSGRTYDWDNSSWNLHDDIGSTTLYGVDGIDGRAFAVGSSGRIYSWTGGNSWNLDTDTGSETHRAVSVVNSTLAYAVSDNGDSGNALLYKWDGNSWELFKPNVMYAYSGESTSGLSCGDSSSDSLSLNWSYPALNANYSAFRVVKALGGSDPSNVTIDSIGFGPVAEPGRILARETLQAIATTGNGTYYASSDGGTLQTIYCQIAENINTRLTLTQILSFSGNLTPATLFTDSFIEYGFNSTLPDPGYQEISVAMETENFPSCKGAIFIPSPLRVVDSKITSYSSDLWTSLVVIENSINQTVFNLSDYRKNFTDVGDPFIVRIPENFIAINSTNYINVSLGNNIDNISSSCSSSNRLIYKARLRAAVTYGTIFQKASGGIYRIYFDKNFDGFQDGFIDVTIGDDLPEFNNTLKNMDDLDPNNAIDDALSRLLELLNFAVYGFNTGSSGSLNNPIDIELKDVDISSSSIVGIPFTWGPAEVKIEVGI
jgi:hypothetical protein